MITVKQAQRLLKIAKGYAANEKLADRVQRLYDLDRCDQGDTLEARYYRSEERLDKALRKELLQLVDAHLALAK